MTINQSTQATAINWQSFDIGAGKAVVFVQPDAGSVLLNRVLGSDPSVILGNLSANGKVFLVNPNGVLFGQGSQIDVGGLVASTLHLSDADLLAGRYAFSGAGGGTVINQGTINAEGGYVVLMGASVANEGLIQANMGMIALAGGEAITLDVAGDGLLSVVVDKGEVDTLVRNGGLLRADGGRVLMTAQAAGQLVATVVNNSGVIEARTLDNHAGNIALLGDMQSGTINVSGTLDASAPTGGDGGFVETSAATVNIADAARVTTFAANGKTGTWLLDPFDYRIATLGGDETPAQVTISLALSNRVIEAEHDIAVADAVTWTTPQTLELRAGNDVLINAAMTASTAGAAMRFVAGHDVVVKGVLTASAAGTLIQMNAGREIVTTAAVTASGAGALIEMNAGQDIRLNEAVTASGGGAVILRADSDGSGGLDGGTVRLSAFPVTTTSKTIYYSPENGYAAPNAYTGFTSYMWTFVAANGKAYDGTVAATARFRGDPTAGGLDVALTGGTIAFADKNAGAAKPANFSGYSLAGGDAALFALFATSGSTTAAITPALLSVTANGATKSYGQSPSFAGTAFTSSGLVNGETIGSVTATSLGAAATASVAGSPYLITPSAATGGTFSAGNYAITYVDGALAVTPAALLITANDAAKTYGDLLTFAGTEFGTVGLQNGETIGSVSEASLGAATTAGVVGNPYAITAANAVGGTFASGNYAITYADGALTVTPATLLITASNAAKTYGDLITFTGSEFTSSGLKNGETIGTISQTSMGAATTAGVAGGPYAIAASAATGGTFNAANYSVGYADGALTVARAALHVTANDAAKSYGQVLTLAGTAFSVTGLRNGETIGSVTNASQGAVGTAGVAGSPYAITASDAAGGTFAADNYAISYSDGALRVTPAALLITANNAAKTYGDLLAFVGAEFVSAGLQNGETIGSVTEVSLGAAVTASVSGSPYAITASAATGGTFNAANYVATYADGALIVTPAALLITANDAGKTYGQAVTLAGTAFSASGLRNGETVGSVTQASLGAAAAASVAGGPYAITVSGATGGTFAAGNYAISYSDGALSVARAPLSVTAGDVAKTYGQAATLLATAFTSAGLHNGDVIDGVSQSSMGSAATASVAGAPYMVTAAGAFGTSFVAGNYATIYVDGALTVTPAALLITANDASKTYGDTLAFAGGAFAAAGLQNGETIGSVSEASSGADPTADVAGSLYAIRASGALGGTFSASNYAISYADGALSVTPAPLSVTANDATKTYGQPFTFSGTAFTASGLRNGDIIIQVTQTSGGAAPTAGVAGGPYAITPSNGAGSNFVAANYSVTYRDGVLTVTPAALRVTASDAAKTYGDALVFGDGAFTVAGLQNGETIGAVTSASAGADPSANVSSAGYAIIASGARGGSYAPANYVTTYADGVLTIVPAPLTVRADDATKPLGQTLAFDGTEFSAIGLRNDDAIDVVTQASLGAVDTATVDGGPYVIAVGDALGADFIPGNYTTSYVSGVLTVTSVATPPAIPPVVMPPTLPAVSPPIVIPPAVPPAPLPVVTPVGSPDVTAPAAAPPLLPDVMPVTSQLPGARQRLQSRPDETAHRSRAPFDAPPALELAVIGAGIRMPFNPSALTPQLARPRQVIAPLGVPTPYKRRGELQFYPPKQSRH